MRIAICEFRQESNSFNPVITTRDYFACGGIFDGQAFVEKALKEPCAASGMLHELMAAKAEVIPAYSMVSQSGGPVAAAVTDEFLEKALPTLRANLPLDGVLVSLHGATQGTECDDVSGMILERIREVVGQKTVISCSCDLHANVTAKMIRNADFVCGYRTYPHSDYYETGSRAARMALKRIAGEQLIMVGMRIPMIVPANSYTTLSGFFCDLMQEARDMVTDGTLYDASIFQMQPWLDVPDGGSIVLAIAKDEKKAQQKSEYLARKLFDNRSVFEKKMQSIDKIVDLAEKNTRPVPVVLVDSADSTNAGAPGDSAAVLRCLADRGSQLKTAFVLNDLPAVEKAFAAGVGAKLDLTLGCSKNKTYSVSVDLSVEVVALFPNATFAQEGPAGKGLINHIGDAAVLHAGNMDILVCENINGNGDPQLYRAFGIEPTAYQLVVVKACTSFRAAYALMTDLIYDANTMGAACPDLSVFTFEKLPKSFYPFTTEWKYDPLSVEVGRA